MCNTPVSRRLQSKKFRVMYKKIWKGIISLYCLTHLKNSGSGEQYGPWASHIYKLSFRYSNDKKDTTCLYMLQNRHNKIDPTVGWLAVNGTFDEIMGLRDFHNSLQYPTLQMARLRSGEPCTYNSLEIH